jgi:tyrocidine synthetase-3
MFNVFVDFLNPGNINRLSGLKYIFLAGEALLPGLVERFGQLAPGIVLENLYGPTEAAIYASYYSLSQWEGGETIPIGKPTANIQLYILDRCDNLQPMGIVGELCIGGVGLARGYLNRLELTAEKFVEQVTGAGDRCRCINKKFLRGSVPPGGRRQKIYRTGDLARWLPDGNIEFLGRIDHQVKIRGFRIELGEIENQLLTHGKIKEAIVLARENNNEKFLCAYFAVTPGETNTIDQLELRKYLSNRLPDYMIPSYFVQLDRMPLTPSGKINRKTLPAPAIEKGNNFVAPRDDIETKLVEMWSDILKVEKEKISINGNFFRLGGHSLNAMVLASRIHKDFNINAPLGAIFKTPRISGIAAFIKKTAESKHIPVEPVEKKEYYPLSSAQRRLYILQHMDDKGGTGYNIPSVWYVEGDLDVEKFAGIFQQLILRHESFRTFFSMVNNEPVQRVYDESVIGHWSLVIGEAGKSEIEDRIKNFIKPFDLSRAPLLRVELIKIDGQNHILTVDMHHIISDGLSIEIILKEFAEFYEGQNLSVLRLQYKDYGQWYHRQVDGGLIKDQGIYWLKQFEGEVPVLNLSTDYLRPSVQDFVGRAIHFEISKEETAALKSLVREQEVTLFMLLLSLYNIFLCKLSGQEDIVVGTPISGRRHSDLENIIGMFVNTLALRNFPVGEKTFTRFLKEVKENTIKAFENQDYLYEDLVERVEVERDTGRNPLFDTMLVLQNIDSPGVEIPGLKVEPYHYESGISKFDLTLRAIESEDRLAFTFQYCTSLFKEETIRRLIGFFKKTISTAAENNGIRISGIEIITKKEKYRLLNDFNDSGAEYPGDKTIHQLFEEQVAQGPDRIAAVGPQIQPAQQVPGDGNNTGSISYNELNRKANQLAYGLIEKGAAADTIVGIMVEPSIEIIVGILGILKTGGAYLPIDPDSPRERIDFILKDSRARILLCLDDRRERVKSPEEKEEIECLFLDHNIIYTGSYRNPDTGDMPAGILYTIYTSGSTGKPKGVVLTHENLVNYFNWFSSAVGVTRRDKSLVTSSLAFDLGYTAFYPPLLSGGELHIIDKETYLFVSHLLDYIAERGITYLKITPALFAIIVDSDEFTARGCQSLRLLVLGGEAIITRDVEKAFSRLQGNGIRIMNHYGPTETTIGSVAQLIDSDPCRLVDYIQTPTIGHPIHNTRVYILDRYFNLSPFGTAGELCIAGRGLARGYLNRPELTAEKFKRAVNGHSSLVVGGSFKFSTNVQCPMTNDSSSKSPTNDRSHPTHSATLTPLRHCFPLLTHSSYSPLYRTGDLARWRPDGNIEFLGRIDFQVKIRGFRIELGEIESQLLTHGKIKEAVVLAGEDNDNKYLCAYIVPKSSETKPINQLGIREYLSLHLPNYMVPAYFVQLDELPLTPNGKINRKALPAPGVERENDYVAPRDEVEKKLVGIWSEILGVDEEKISIDANFFHLGGHSLKATIISAKIHKEFNVKVPVVEIFKIPTIRELAQYIKIAGKEKYEALEFTELKDYYPLSSSQKRLFIRYYLEGEEKGVSYNIPGAFKLEGQLDIETFENTFRRLIARHETLRTSFFLHNGHPVQKIHDTVTFSGSWQKCSEEEVREKALLFSQPFDLSCAPLLRVELLQVDREKYFLLFDFHHIISDGISMEIMVNEFASLYTGKPLVPLSIQYKDYAVWQNKWLNREGFKTLEEFWLNYLEGFCITKLPSDKFTGTGGDVGKSEEAVIDRTNYEKIKTFSVNHGITRFTLMLSIFFLVIAAETDQKDIVLGVPMANREHHDLENLIGVFLNVLLIRSKIDENDTFLTYLSNVKKAVSEAVNNGSYPYELLVEKVRERKKFNNDELFSILFNYLPEKKNNEILTGKFKITGVNPYKISPKFDITMYLSDYNSVMKFTLVYKSNILGEYRLQRMVKNLLNIINRVLENETIRLSDIDILDYRDKDRFDREFPEYLENGDLFSGPPMQLEPVHIKIANISRQKPDNIAICCGEKAITYLELEKSSNRIANFLNRKMKELQCLNRHVVVALDRSPELIQSILGIFKSGSIFVPVDPLFPGNRLKVLIREIRSEWVITSPDYLQRFESILDENHCAFNILVVGEGQNRESAMDNVYYWKYCSRVNHELEPGIPPEKNCYIYFTSGSTGVPKGVMGHRRGLAHFIQWEIKEFGVNENFRVSQLTNPTFDPFLRDILLPLVAGAACCIPEYNVLMNPPRLIRWLDRSQVNLVHIVPSLFKEIVRVIREDDCLFSLKYILFAGELLRGHDIRKFIKIFRNRIQLVNLYGPTETTLAKFFYRIKEEDVNRSVIPVGKAIEGAQGMILNKAVKPCLIGNIGEVYIRTPFISSGYFNDKDLTRKVFLKNPFSNNPQDIVYKTGDLGRILPDGNVELTGRVDFQVKIRGMRVELGEIENRLLKHEDVKELVVTAGEDESGNKYLCAYIVPAADRPLDVPALKAYLSKELPQYMVPSFFVNLENMPLNPNGKIDRKKLPNPKESRVNAENTYEAPTDEIEEKIARVFQKVLHLKTLDVKSNFFDLGANSLKIIEASTKLNEIFKKEIPVAKLFEHSTISSLAKYVKKLEEQEQGIEKRFRPSGKVNQKANTRNREIAVIGMSCRFPGAKNTREFWEVLKQGTEAITFFSDEELLKAGVPTEALNNPDYVKAASLLTVDKRFFDASFFEYTPKEAELMDPQIRLFHECCWEALEDGGIVPDLYEGSIGVYAGAVQNLEWESRVFLSGKSRSFGEFPASKLSGIRYLCTRLSYNLNLKGPSVTMQTACSTSLVAIHMACRALVNNECDAAIAGGVTASARDRLGYLYEEGMIYSQDGHNRTFDALGNGTIFGEGIGVVVLRPLDDAIDGGDHIYAVIKGSAVNNDGNRKVGFTAPSVSGQVEVIRAAFEEAEIDPETIGYVEAHGTATKVGDPIEIEALTQAFNTSKKVFCKIGSVKSNFGHLDAAAGVAGFIKTVLVIKYREIPPNIHFDTTNSGINFASSPFEVNRRLTPWKKGEYPLRAGVSAMGMGGTNAHVILQEAPGKEESTGSRPYHLILISAKSKYSLDKAVKNLSVFLEKNNEANLADVAYTLQTARKRFNHRLMVTCQNIHEAVDILSQKNNLLPGVSAKPSTFVSKNDKRPVVFMFPGQGTQYINMGLDLYRTEAIFRDELDRCLEILDPILDVPIKDILYPTGEKTEEARESINRTYITQPLLFIFEYTLAKIFIHWGIKPDIMIGHSIGEYVAAHLAGVFSLEDALKLVALRGRLIQALPPGAMLSIQAPPGQIEPLLKGELSLAAVNSSTLCVVSGPSSEIDNFARTIEKKGYQNRIIKTSHAFHSKMMEPVLKKFEREVERIRFNKPDIPYVSNLTGDWISFEEVANPHYWTQHLRKTVRFSEGLEKLFKKEGAILIEVGPGNALSKFANRHSKKTDNHIIMNLVRHPRENVPDVYYLLNKFGRLWIYGQQINWTSFYYNEKRHRISLPPYPFDSEYYWVEKVDYRNFNNNTNAGKKKEIADWFYIPSWKRKRSDILPENKIEYGDSWNLVFMDDRGLSSGLLNKLEQDPERGKSVRVNIGTGYNEVSSVSFTINPASDDDYEKLFRRLSDTGQIPDRIIHLWNVTGLVSERLSIGAAHRAQDIGFYSFINIAKAAGNIFPGKKIDIIAITDNMQDVDVTGSITPEKSPILGAVLVIPQEHQDISCRSIDISLNGPGNWEKDGLIDHLILELFGSSPEKFTAYRSSSRLVPCLYQTQFKDGPVPGTKIKENGAYLIIGGLGTIGFIIAEHFVKSYKANLALVGQTGFPGKEKWDNWLSSHDNQDAVSQKIKKVRELEDYGGEVLVLNADVANLEKMRYVIDETEKRLGPIKGVVHAAGRTEGPSIGLIPGLDKSRCEPQFNPKMDGLIVMEKIFKDKKLDFCMLISSISSFLGGLKCAAYCAANIFMDRFIKETERWVSINFDSVDTNNNNEVETSLSPGELIDAFELILKNIDTGQIIVSTSDLYERIEKAAKLKNHTKSDEPGKENGTVQKVSSSLSPGDNPLSNYFTSFSKTEKEILKIWEELLGYKKISPDDNFFELGGDSLTAGEVRKRIKKVFNVEIPVVKIFHYPTIHSFVENLLEENQPKDDYEFHQENQDKIQEDVINILGKF